MTDPAATYSYINMILLSVIGGAFFLLCTVMGYWASSVNKQLKDICDDQASESLVVHGLGQWTKNHDKQDDERHKDLNRRSEGIARDLGRLFEYQSKQQQRHRQHNDEEDERT